MERQLTFAGIMAESEARERVWQDRRDRLEAVMAMAGIRAGTLPWLLAKLIHKVAGTSDGVLRRTNPEIAKDPDMRKRNGARPKAASIKAAAARLRQVGILVQENIVDEGVDMAARWIDHAAVLGMFEAGSIEICAPEIAPVFAGEIASDLGGESASETGGEKTARLYSSISTKETKEPSSSANPTPAAEEEGSFGMDDGEQPDQDEADTLADYIAIFGVQDRPGEQAALRQALGMAQRGLIDVDAFLGYVDEVIDRLKLPPPDHVRNPCAYLLAAVRRDVAASERSEPCLSHC